MFLRGLVVGALAACTFEPHTAPSGTPSDGGDLPPPDAHGADARGVDASVDVDAHRAVDAKVIADAPPPPGSLSVTAAALSAGNIDLTSEGSADWAHWGFADATSFDHEAGANLISNATISGSTQLGVTEVAVSASWSNGAPDATANQTATGTGTQSPGALTFTAPAGIAAHTLRVYIGGHGAQGKIDVSLSDNSAAPYTNDEFSGDNAWHSVYTITYNASSDDQTVSVIWSDEMDSSEGGFAMLLSATLQ